MKRFKFLAFPLLVAMLIGASALFVQAGSTSEGDNARAAATRQEAPRFQISAYGTTHGGASDTGAYIVDTKSGDVYEVSNGRIKKLGKVGE